MKFSLSALISLIAIGVNTISASTHQQQMMEMQSLVKADSKFGRNLLSQARRLDGTEAVAEYNETWLAGYSLVFQGCHHISQWNDDADDEGDVRIATKRLVRFRLCPADSCSATSGGCSSNYGDYVVDMNVYLQLWFSAKQEYQSFQCDYLAQYACACNNEEEEENFNADQCKWDCYSGHNMEGICMENNPYANDDGASAAAASLDLETYMECAEANVNNNGRRRLDGNAAYDSEWDGKYYIGPYCASQGGQIFLGMFVDNTCSSFADSTGGRQTYYDLTLQELPYGDTNVVDMDCLSCKEPAANNNDGDDAEDADEISEVCEKLYTYAGKCEQSYTAGVVESPNNNACNYMEGIKIVRNDGTVMTRGYKANKTASVFIGIFVASFLILAAYSYYLKTKLDRASITLAE